MKVYTYRPEEVAHFQQTGPIGLRLGGTTAVDSPEEADVIASPVPLLDLPDRAAMARLPHFARFEAKHVFLDISDCKHTYGGTSALLLRCDQTEALRAIDRRSLAWPWPVEDWAEIAGMEPAAVPAGGFQFNASFHGWLSTDTRQFAVNSCRGTLRGRFDSATYTGFFGHQSPQEMAHRRAAYAASLKASRLSICPESDPGVPPYRLYEALAAGRPPVLFSTGYVLPFADEIPWSEIAFLHESVEAPHAGDIVEKIRETHSDAELQAMGRRGREWWERRLAGARWDALFTLVVARAFGLEVAGG